VQAFAPSGRDQGDDVLAQGHDQATAARAVVTPLDAASARSASIRPRAAPIRAAGNRGLIPRENTP